MSGVRVLVIHFGSLGDFVLAWHAMGRLAAWAGRGNLRVAARAGLGELVVGPGQVVALEGPMIAGAMSPQPPGDVLRWLGRFEVVVVFSSGARPQLGRNVELAGAALWQLPTRPPRTPPVHIVEAQLKALEARGLSSPAPPLLPRLPSRLPPPCPVVAPGSGGLRKRLAPELAGRIIDELSSSGKVKLLFGPAEDPAYRRQVLQSCSSTPEVLPELPLKQLLPTLAAASPYLGPDSGITHLAAALGAPTVAVFTATDPALWAPVGPRVEVLRLKELTAAQLH